jgi:ArsR family transcriptional regulator
MGSHISDKNQMTKDEKKLLDYINILADESRYKIILYLMKGEECVCVLADKLNLERTLVSHHLQTLREAGFIQDRKVGTWVHCSLNKKTFAEMETLYQKFLSSKNISDKPCNTHDVCRQLLRKNYENKNHYLRSSNVLLVRSVRT